MSALPSPTVDTRKPWERQRGETAKAFQGFVTYRNLGPGQRTIAKAAIELGKSAGLLHTWSAKHGWVERALEWDVERDRLSREAEVIEAREAGRRHALIAERALEKVDDAITHLNPEKMSAAEVSSLMSTAVRVERQARGMDKPEEAPKDTKRGADLLDAILRNPELVGIVDKLGEALFGGGSGRREIVEVRADVKPDQQSRGAIGSDERGSGEPDPLLNPGEPRLLAVWRELEASEAPETDLGQPGGLGDGEDREAGDLDAPEAREEFTRLSLVSSMVSEPVPVKENRPGELRRRVRGTMGADGTEYPG